MQRFTPVVLNLIIINTLVFFAQAVFEGPTAPIDITDYFALHHYKSEQFKPHQLITHMFLHGGLFHLLFNMLALWMFGSMMERVWGPKRFIQFYFICGIVAGVAQMINYAVTYQDIDAMVLQTNDWELYQEALRRNATVGASGAIMGVLAAYAYTFPNTELFIMPIPFPIKAKWAIMGIIALDVFGGVASTPNDNIAHFAHVGGALCGLLIVWIWNRNRPQRWH
ncbi:MAG: rhomboid family intramembrane serine protease [Ferruginibacter sp.]